MTTTTTTKEVKWFAITLADISKTPHSKTSFMKSLVTSCMFRSTVQRQDKNAQRYKTFFSQVIFWSLLAGRTYQDSGSWLGSVLTAIEWVKAPGNHTETTFSMGPVWLRMCPTKWVVCFRTTLPIKPRVIVKAAGQNLLQTSTSSCQGAQISSYLLLKWKTGEMIIAIKIFFTLDPPPPPLLCCLSSQKPAQSHSMSTPEFSSWWY